MSPRTLEICRQFGLDAKHIRRLGTQRSDAFWVNFVTNLSGEAVGVLPYERMDAAVLDETPEVLASDDYLAAIHIELLTYYQMIHNIPHPVLEQFLTAHILKDPNIEIRKGFSFDSLEQVRMDQTASDLLPHRLRLEFE